MALPTNSICINVAILKHVQYYRLNSYMLVRYIIIAYLLVTERFIYNSL